MVTIYDIAKRANVSAMTVSRVINNTGRISDETRARVKKVMEEMHYVPNQMARSLVLQATRMLYLLITDITNPFFTTLARGAEDAANEAGYRLLFGNSDEDVDKEQEYMDTILQTRADGALITPCGDRSLANLQVLRQRGVPFVLLDREVPGIECDVVLGDSMGGTRMLMDYLIAQGHRRIALVNAGAGISSARQRLCGYREALRHNGIAFEPAYVLECGYGSKRGPDIIAQWLQSLDPAPTAIFCGNNVLAVEAVQAIRSKGLRVPEDISVVCFDDLGPFSSIDPFLTVAAQQAYEFGYTGMRLLIDRIEGKSGRDECATDEPAWRKVILPAELIVRKSVRKLD